MKSKIKSFDLHPLSVATKAIRQRLGFSQERFAREVAIAAQTLSRFERGRAVPRDFHVLMKLRDAAGSAGLEAEEALFQQAIDAHPEKPLQPASPPPRYSFREWRLMQACRAAVRVAPEMEQALLKLLAPMLEEIVYVAAREAQAPKGVDLAGWVLDFQIDEAADNWLQRRALGGIQ